MPGLPVEPKQYGHKVFCDIWAGLLQCAGCCTQNYQEGCVEHRFLDPPPTACGLAKLQCAQELAFLINSRVILVLLVTRVEFVLPHPTRRARCELSVSHMLSRCSTSGLTPATKTTVYGVLRVWTITLLPFQTVPEKSPCIVKAQESLGE